VRAAVAVFAVLALVVCLPAVLEPSGARLYDDGGDFFFTCWSQWWVQRSVLDGHGLSFSTDLIFYPQGGSLYPVCLVNALLTLPLHGVLTPAALFNLSVGLNIFLSGLLSFFFFHRLTKDRDLSVVGGVIFAASPFLLSQVTMGVLEGTGLWWLPLENLVFLRTVERRSVPWALALAACTVLLLLADVYYAVCAFLFIACYLAFHVRALFEKPHGASLRRTLLIALAVTAALALPLYRAVSATCSGDTLTEQNRASSLEFLEESGSPDLLAFVLPSKADGRTLERVSLGLPLLLLALIPLPGGSPGGGSPGGRSQDGRSPDGRSPDRRNPDEKKRERLFLLATAAAGFLLALGPYLVAGGKRLCAMPYYYLFKYVGPFQLLNKPYRLVALVYFCLGAYCLLRLAPLLAGSRHRRAIAVLLCLVFLLSSLSFFPAMRRIAPIDASYPDFCEYLRKEPGTFAIFEVPSLDIHVKRAEAFEQTLHGRNIAGALTHRYPPSLEGNPFLMQLAALELKEAPPGGKNPYPPGSSSLGRRVAEAVHSPAPAREVVRRGAAELRALGFRYVVLNGRHIPLEKSALPEFCAALLGEPIRFRDGLLYRL